MSADSASALLATAVTCAARINETVGADVVATCLSIPE
jgi:hypothetical protein